MLNTSEKMKTESFSRRVGPTNQRIDVIANGRLGPINLRSRQAFGQAWIPMSVAQATALRSQLQSAISMGIQDAP